MSSEATDMEEERRKAKELKAFAEARAAVQARAKEYLADAEVQLSELKKRTVDGFKNL
jgi:hypothetical protein